MYIKSLKLENYKGFSHLDISFNKEMNVLYGINGTGKTTILEVLFGILYLFSNTVILSNFSLLRNDYIRIGKDTVSIHVVFVLDDGSEKNIIISRTKADVKSNDVPFTYNWRKENTLADGTLITGDIQDIPSECCIYICSFDIGRWAMNFPAFKDMYKHQEMYENGIKVQKNDLSYEDEKLKRFRQALVELNPDFHNIRIDYNDPSNPIVINKKNTVLNVETQLSQGEKRAIYILGTACLSSNAPISYCLLDEIDASLHPEWQCKICSLLQKTLPNVQIFATSHSPFVLANLPREYVRMLTIDENGDIQANEVDFALGATVDEIIATYFSTAMGLSQDVSDKIEEIDKMIVCKQDTEEIYQKIRELKNKYGMFPALYMLFFKVKMMSERIPE